MNHLGANDDDDDDSNGIDGGLPSNGLPCMLESLMGDNSHLKHTQKHGMEYVWHWWKWPHSEGYLSGVVSFNIFVSLLVDLASLFLSFDCELLQWMACIITRFFPHSLTLSLSLFCVPSDQKHTNTLADISNPHECATLHEIVYMWKCSLYKSITK